MTEDTRKAGLTRRGIPRKARLWRVWPAQLEASRSGRMGGAEAQTQPPRHSTEVAPGELDEYYVFSIQWPDW